MDSTATTPSGTLDEMLAGIAETITEQEVQEAQETAQSVAEQEVVMHIRMFAAAPEDA